MRAPPPLGRADAFAQGVDFDETGGVVGVVQLEDAHVEREALNAASAELYAGEAVGEDGGADAHADATPLSAGPL